MSDYSMADISSLLQSVGRDGGVVAKNSTSRKGNTDLDMTDFLKLMVVQLQSQTMDDTMDTSEMMNQMVQMQMVSAITNMTETNIMTYASSLVGKEVTIGIVENNELVERVINVTGTGMSDGKQVIFGDDGETYNLSQIMAVGRLPEIEGITKPDDSTGESNTGTGSAQGTGSNSSTNSAQGTGGNTGTSSAENSGSTEEVNGGENKAPVENPNGTGSEDKAEDPVDESKEPIVESPELSGELVE